ncbi:MAG: septum formation initiator family protein [Verrucomicrobiia bacterium]
MAKNRRNQSAAIRFGPALKALFLCLVIAGLAVGYVWQKSQIYQLGQQITSCEHRLAQLRDENQRLGDQLAVLRSPVMLDQRVRALNLGLVPAQPTQIYRLVEPPPNDGAKRQFAARQDGGTTQ